MGCYFVRKLVFYQFTEEVYTKNPSLFAVISANSFALSVITQSQLSDKQRSCVLLLTSLFTTSLIGPIPIRRHYNLAPPVPDFKTLIGRGKKKSPVSIKHLSLTSSGKNFRVKKE